MVGNGHGSAQRRTFLQSRLHLDGQLLTALLLLSAVGMMILYSATDQDIAELHKQAIRLGIAFGIMLGVAQIPPQTLRRWTPWVFGAGLIMLFLVLVMGTVGGGAKRWLNFGVFRFQPSEMMKLAIPMMVSWYLAEHSLPPRIWRVLATSLLILIPMGLIVKQPDLGTALLVGSSGFFVLFFAGLSWRLIIGTVAAGAALAPLFWFFGMHQYQQDRVLTFLNPQRDPLGAGYHIIQSTIAIGSGGLYGKGWLNGTQAHLNFIPERHTDFIFAVFSEEFGLAGAALLLVLYLFVIVRGLYIANQAQDTFSRLLAGGISLTFFVYVFINMGMVSGLLPVVGLPLPMISYGGTSMVTLLAGFGILMSIHTHRKLWSS